MPTPLVGRGAQPPTEAGEVRATVGRQADELAVEQHLVSPEHPCDGGQFWELLAAVPAEPRAQAHRLPVAAQLKPHPIELHLDAPTGTGPLRANIGAMKRGSSSREGMGSE